MYSQGNVKTHYMTTINIVKPNNLYYRKLMRTPILELTVSYITV